MKIRNKDTSEVFYTAIIKGEHSKLKALLKYYDPRSFKTNDGMNALELAICLDRKNIFRMLLPFFTSRTSHDALHYASAIDDLVIVKALVEKGFNINKKGNGGRIPLHWAAQENSVRVGTFLLDKHSKINSGDDAGSTPLSTAVGLGHYEITKLLLQYKANVNRRDNTNGTALHLAYAWSRKKIISLLLKNGADPEIRDDDGKKPIDYSPKVKK